MGLFSAFSQSESDKRKSHLKNLIEVAFADGEVADTEFEMLLAIAEKFEMTRQDVLEIRDNPESVKFNPPSSYKLKVMQIYDLVKMMLADNEIHENEVKLCKAMALKLNISPVVVDDMIDIIVGSITKQESEENIINKLMKLND